MQLNYFLYGLIVGALPTLTSGVSTAEKTKKEHYKDAMALVPVVKVPAAHIHQKLDSLKFTAFQIILVDEVTIGNSCFEAVPKENKCLEAINKKRYVKAKNCDVYNAAQLWVLEANNKICLKTDSKKKCLAPFSDKNQKKLTLSRQENGFSWVYDLLSSQVKAITNDQSLVLSVNQNNFNVKLKEPTTSSSFAQKWHFDFWLPASFATKKDLQAAVDKYCDKLEEDETYGPIANWDVSQITDMRELFKEKDDCNPSIEQWNVSNVKYFSSMFAGAIDGGSDFNQNISTWDVSKGLGFSYMFAEATSFNHDIGSWNVSKGVNFSFMFSYVSNFNQDIGTWDVSNGKYFRRMFNLADSFDQDIGRWNVSKGSQFDYMFFGGSSFDHDISSWNVSKGVDFESMFNEASNFNKNIGSWDVSNGKYFNGMFFGASSFDQNLCPWNNLNDIVSSALGFCVGAASCFNCVI